MQALGQARRHLGVAGNIPPRFHEVKAGADTKAPSQKQTSILLVK
jgi:hypothetical protein